MTVICQTIYEELTMSLNGKKVGEFALKAYKNGEFIDVTDKDLQGKIGRAHV